MFFELKENSLFVADSHYNEKNKQFLIFLEKLKSKEIECKQLILMGDMFDFISSESKYFVKRNQKLLDIINELSNDIDILYFEGNHDYNMQPLFKNVKVIKREKQPLLLNYKNKKIAICHGDIFTPKSYDIYCKVIRNHYLLIFLNMLDIKNFISKKIYYALIKKIICFDFKEFETLALKRSRNFDADIIVEGHFHQGKQYTFGNKRYINIPSLCCSQEYSILKDEQFIKIKLNK
ncbi:UDP-2,3-diacylglucosamine hydrolase [Malaciobacter molluscorum LMG 25693]|uniref:UDP-2,3-diacylglucosamine hydrolase n=1 Tax=Malaciobacter molluscorum LMG 25693 TaxID=870501 RepID=A0A2G1DFX3_9BACT|nr:metallophosphoesterase [Malaciobacter molluscorum]AXX91727.1 UDP-2,3-diacylglucosamine hydrolase [Malaciobacter molluscorum LMG 25693]PHO17385.1 UDP-2,3-diacylglucosamine hydrolase [Malaciobacter molluscorum LMG 25693]